MTSFFSYDDFIEKARAFHGCASPGLMIGSSMVELALHSLGRVRRYHALCETTRDLPDAIQLLTPCTTGNGRLHVLDLGRFALTLYRQFDGKGVRVSLDLAGTEGWPHIRRWALGRESSDEKSLVRLEREIRKAGISIPILELPYTCTARKIFHFQFSWRYVGKQELFQRFDQSQTGTHGFPVFLRITVQFRFGK